MKSIIQIVKTDPNEIDPLRIEYLDHLLEFQELYLELLVETAQFYKIIADDSLIGYCIISSNNILIEFYTKEENVNRNSEVFHSIMKNLTIDSIYCKSFDTNLYNCCKNESYESKVIGTLFRDYVATPNFIIDDISIRWAENEDYPFLLQQEGELYETPEELKRFVFGRNILMFEKNSTLLGCGYLIKVHPNYNYYDIGMWVHPNYRKKGIASFIISFLKELCINKQWFPICGCAVENIASKNTLEKCGFISNYQLVEFSNKN